MKTIEVIIQPYRLEDAKRALDHPWIAGLTVTEVKGHGRAGRRVVEVHRGAEYVLDLVPELKVEIVVPDALVPRVLHDLSRSLRTGRLGDGKIFVSGVDEAIRVRTGERGEDAL